MTDQPVDEQTVTDEQRAAFLAYVEQHPSCSVREACEHVGVKRYAIRALKAADEDFAEDYREARGYGDDAIRAALAERAITGVEEPIVNGKGDVVGHRFVTSDRLLEFLARMHLPEAKALQAHRVGLEVTGKDGGPVQLEGKRVVSLGEVVDLAQQLGVDVGVGVRRGDAGDSRLALPSPEGVLSDRRDG